MSQHYWPTSTVVNMSLEFRGRYIMITDQHCNKERIRFQFKILFQICQEYRYSIENVFMFSIFQRCTLIFAVSGKEIFLQLLQSLVRTADTTMKSKIYPCVAMQNCLKMWCSVPKAVKCWLHTIHVRFGNQWRKILTFSQLSSFVIYNNRSNLTYTGTVRSFS